MHFYEQNKHMASVFWEKVTSVVMHCRIKPPEKDNQ